MLSHNHIVCVAIVAEYSCGLPVNTRRFLTFRHFSKQGFTSKFVMSGPSILIVIKEFIDEVVKRERILVFILPRVLNPLSQSAECTGITKSEAHILAKFG